MPRVGIVGGLGPESTIDYYRRILEAWERLDPSSTPSIVIDSLDVATALRLVERDRPALVEYLLASLVRLAGAGVDFAAMTANTPHIVFDELAVRSPVPLVSIVEVCADEARRRGLRRLALLGTRFTMEADFFPAVFARRGIEVVSPGENDRAWVHERYVGELLKGDFRDETRRQIVALVDRLRVEEGVDGVILGGTELPLLLPGTEIAGLPALDTTALHVAAIVARLRQDGRPAVINFSYGSNMLVRRLQERAPSARVIATGVLTGHALRWHKVGQDHSGKCDALATGNDNDVVYGVLYEICRGRQACARRCGRPGGGLRGKSCGHPDAGRRCSRPSLLRDAHRSRHGSLRLVQGAGRRRRAAAFAAGRVRRRADGGPIHPRPGCRAGSSEREPAVSACDSNSLESP